MGGETAEMPDMYKPGDYDLAGFCQGVVEEDNIIESSQVRTGDVLIGLQSSGLHSNGYSLVRKVIDNNNIDIHQQKIGETLLRDLLLAPTRIYVQPLLKLFRSVPVHAIAHITGGGLLENIPRVLPKRTCAMINSDSWQMPTIFQWLQKTGNIDMAEMYRSFNCGIGMVLAVSQDHVEDALNILSASGEQPLIIGSIVESLQKDLAPYVSISALK